MVMLTITPAKFSKLDARPSDNNQPEGGHLTKILVVDAHFLIREALRGVLRELNNRVVIMEVMDGGQAMQFVSEHAGIGFILFDLNLPDRDGFAVLRELRERHPAISVVMLSARQDRESVAKALDLGVLGFIPKSAPREILVSALRLVFAGGTYIPPEMLAGEDLLLPAKLTCATSAQPARPTDLGLSDRQVDVLDLMMQGKSNKAICRVLNLAEPTVKNHVTAVLKVLKVTNRTEAVITVRGLAGNGRSQADESKVGNLRIIRS